MTEDDDEIDSEGQLTFDHPHYRYKGQPFVPKIFDAGPGETVPAGFNAVRIFLDGGVRSDLNWRMALDSVDQYRVQGLKLLWDLDMGLFSRLPQPFTKQAQVQTLRLAVQHFCDKIWPNYSDDTLGIVLYRGSVDFSIRFPWDTGLREAFDQWRLDVAPDGDEKALARLFCRDACAQYLGALAAGMPGSLQPYLFLDATPITNPGEALQLLHRECWDRFVLGIKGSPVPTLGLGWDVADSPFGFIGRQYQKVPELQEAKIGLCLPGADVVSATIDKSLDSAVQSLQAAGKPYRVIAEAFLTADWEGLDYLVVVSASVGPLAKRKLQGFCAAGGTVLTVGEPLGLPREQAFS